MHPTFLPLLLLLIPFTLATTLTLTLPASTPHLPSSTRAHLITHGLTYTAPLTRANKFVFRNLSAPGDYNLDIFCRDYDFEPGVVVISGGEGKVEVYRRSRKTGQRGARMLPSESGEVEVRMGRRREYYEGRGGFSLISMLKSPMILMALAGLGLVFGMPYLLENMDPEMRKEFEEQQKHSVAGNIAGGGGNPLAGFDMAGWMAGQTKTAGKVEEIEDSPAASAGGGGGGGAGRRRESEGVGKASGRGGGGGGGGQGRRRRG